MGGWPAGAPRIQIEFLAERAAARSGAYTASVNALRIRGPEAGPAFLGPPIVSRHFYILLEVGKRYEKIQLGPDCTRFPKSCVELEGVDDGSQFHLENGQQPWGTKQ